MKIQKNPGEASCASKVATPVTVLGLNYSLALQNNRSDLFSNDVDENAEEDAPSGLVSYF